MLKMQVWFLTSFLLAILDFSCVFGKVNHCDLAKTLHSKYKISKRQVPSLICLAEHGAKMDTSYLGSERPDGSREHGIFQISDKEWCAKNPDAPSKCNVACENLRDDRLDDDIRCVRQILHSKGFSAWDSWKKHCKGAFLLRYIHACHL